MRERFGLPARARVRRGTSTDARFIREVAQSVFSYLGDYATILPTWLAHDGVRTHVLEQGADAIARVRRARRALALSELRLSVADVNLRARRLFESVGFEHDVANKDGLYDGGQVALHFRFRL